MHADDQAHADQPTADELRAEIAALRAERDRLASALKLLEEKHDALLHQIYKKRSERYATDYDEPLFEGLDHPEPPAPKHVDEAPDAEEAELEVPKKSSKKARQRGATRLPDDLRRVYEDIEPSDEQRTCPYCGEERSIIDYEETEKLEYQPASLFLRVIRRPKFACPQHEEAGIAIPDLPPQVLDKSLAGASMLAQVITAKYCDHLPLHRQAGIYGRQGVSLARSTLCDWIADSADLLRPVVDCVLEQAKASGYMSSDDTPVTLLKPGTSSKSSKKAFLWAYLGEQPGDVVFDFREGRGGEGPRDVLDGYRGYLQADAYSAYDRLFDAGGVVEVGCMAHARRKFFEALPHSPEHAEPAMKGIRMLYQIERQAHDGGLGTEHRHQLRQREAAPLFAKLREWISELRAHVLPKSKIGRATGYFDRHADALGRYLEDGRLEIDNNRCERAIRKVAVGRKNWLFAGSPAGGQSAATLYSLTDGCWELGIDPFEYLTEVLVRLESTPRTRIAELTPRAWAAARQG